MRARIDALRLRGAARRAAVARAVNAAKAQIANQLALRLDKSLSQTMARDDYWFDPYVGLRGRYNFNKTYYTAVRGEIGGFGVGADLMWEVESVIGINLTRSIFTEIGYRALGGDFEDKSFVFDVVLHGPQITTGLRAAAAAPLRAFARRCHSQDACHLVAGRDLAQPRRALGAVRHRKAAARREAAALRRLDQARHDAGDRREPRLLRRPGRCAGSSGSAPAYRGGAAARTAPSTGASSTTLPAYITTTRCAVSATTPIAWVISMIAMPKRAFISPSRSRICAWIVTSSAVVGSSAISSFGLQESAIAIITRWRMPPENWCG